MRTRICGKPSRNLAVNSVQLIYVKQKQVKILNVIISQKCSFNMCSNQLSQLSSSSHSIYMDSLNRSQLPLKGMKGRPCDDEAISVEVKKEMGHLHLEEGNKPDVAAMKEVGSIQLSELSSSRSIYLDSLDKSQLPLRELKIRIRRLDLEADVTEEASINETAKREAGRLKKAKQRSAVARREADRLRKAKQRAREKERLEQETFFEEGDRDRHSDDDAIRDVKKEVEYDTLDEATKKELAKREAGRLRTAKHRAKKKLEEEYQDSIEDSLSDDDYHDNSIEDLKKETEEDDILDEKTRIAVARREAQRINKARQRARDKEHLERELAAPDHEVPETALVRKALIKEIEGYPRLWNRTISPKGAKAHDWRQILEQLQNTFESNPGILVRCRAGSADKLRHIWYRLYMQHNLTWKKNGWKDSGMFDI